VDKATLLATDDVIFNVLEVWPLEWHAPNIAEIEKSAVLRNKDEAKLHIAQLEKKRRKEVVAVGVQAARDIAQTTHE